jgi:hypothetical protein
LLIGESGPGAPGYAKPESEISGVKLFGVIEARKHIESERLEIDITLYAMW